MRYRSFLVFLFLVSSECNAVELTERFERARTVCGDPEQHRRFPGELEGQAVEEPAEQRDVRFIVERVTQHIDRKVDVQRLETFTL